MLEVVNGGMPEVVNCGMLEVVNGVAGFCRLSTCAVSKDSCRNIFFKSACCDAELCVSDANTSAFCCCDI